MKTLMYLIVSVCLVSLIHALGYFAFLLASICCDYHALGEDYHGKPVIIVLLMVVGFEVLDAALPIIFIMATIGYYLRKKLLDGGKANLKYYLLSGLIQGILGIVFLLLGTFTKYPILGHFWILRWDQASLIKCIITVSIGTTANGIFWLLRRPDRVLH